MGAGRGEGALQIQCVCEPGGTVTKPKVAGTTMGELVGFSGIGFPPSGWCGKNHRMGQACGVSNKV